MLVGDSMGGGPTGLRVLLRGEGKVKGVVVVGSAAEEESEGTFLPFEQACRGS